MKRNGEQILPQTIDWEVWNLPEWFFSAVVLPTILVEASITNITTAWASCFYNMAFFFEEKTETLTNKGAH